MRIMLTGAAGMLGQDLIPVLADDEVLPVDVRGDCLPLDITDGAAVRKAISSHRPEVVLHCAAYTNVDGCESDSDTAWKVNAGGAWNLAAACADAGIPLLYVSTDFVFDGEKGAAYDEFDTPNPISTYGRTKYAGEVFVRQLARRHYIVRTAWLYGPFGKSFPRTMIDLSRQGKALRVVADQTGCPTYTVDLAQAISGIIRTGLYGTYHVTNSGQCTWYDFALAAVRGSGVEGADICPIATHEWPSPARRPRYSVLEHRALKLAGLPAMRPWEDALPDFLKRLGDT